MNADRRARGLYWDAAWKLVEGCSKVSPGCDNCWSEEETLMRERHPHPYIALRARTVLGGQENGFCNRILTRSDNLELPLRTKKPTVFAIWNDLFHEDVPDAFRDSAYAVMALCPQHTFLVLTKRAERMAKYFERPEGWFFGPDAKCRQFEKVWHGVTAENQQTANERIPQLLRVPGKRFLSIEPMLGPVDLMNLSAPSAIGTCYFQCLNKCGDRPGLDAVLLGGESGPNARPMHFDWVRSVRDQCAEADIPFTLKQWGEWEKLNTENWDKNKPICHLYLDGRVEEWNGAPIHGDPIGMIRVGKRAAGRTLDGVIHNNLPWDGGAA